MTSKTHRPLTVVALMLGLFMAAMEATIVATAMPTANGDLHGFDLYSWVFTAFMLTSTLLSPIYGKLCDLYGRKPIMLFGLTLFMVGSMASGQAQSIGQLICFRAIQGLGAGAMQPTTFTIIGDIFNLEERARMQALFGSVWALAGLIGPALGGVIVEYLSWRWVFYINVPFGLISMGLLMVAFREDVKRRPHRLDFAGAALMMAGCSALLYATHDWMAGRFLYPAVGVCLAILILVERRVAEPLFPPSVLRRRIMIVASASGALFGAAMFSTATYLPLFIQGVCGGTATQAGAALTPILLGWPVAAAISSRFIPRVGFRPLVRIGGLCFAASTVALGYLISMRTPNVILLEVAAGGLGIGLGFANTSLMIAVQTAVDWEERGIATASWMFFRSVGGMISVGATGALLSHMADVPTDQVNRLLGPTRGQGLDPATIQSITVGLASALTPVFWTIGGLGVAALFVCLFFPKAQGENRSVRKLLT